jgi:translocator protein
MRLPALLLTSTAVAATAVLGRAATDPDTTWYRTLDKPRWQPPAPVYGLVWTPIYVLIAVAGGRALRRTAQPRQRRRYAFAFGANLALNAGWTWLFFRLHRPGLALGEIVVLEASTLDLLRRTRRVDGKGAVLLAPYAAWTAFAIVLNAELARRN